MNTPVLESLTDEQIKESQRFRDDWLNIAPEKGADRDEVDNAVKWMYESIKVEKAPHLLWCDSLFQYVTTGGFLFICALDRNLFGAMEKELTDPLWLKSWHKINDLIAAEPELLAVLKTNAEKMKNGTKPSRTGHRSANFLDLLLGSNVEAKIDAAVAEAMAKFEKNLPGLLGTRAKIQLRMELFSGIRSRTRAAVGGRVLGIRSIETLFTGKLAEELTEQLSSGSRDLVAQLCRAYLPKQSGGLAAAMFASQPKDPGVEGLFEDALSAHYTLLDENERFVTSTSWLPLFGFAAQYLNLAVDEKSKEWLTNLLTLRRNHVEMQPYETICFLCEPPQTIFFNDRGFLHNTNAPAITFKDGFNIYMNNGVALSEQIAMRPNELAVEQINGEQNVEVRRIMIQQYGTEKYLEDSGAQAIDSDPAYGVLYRKEQTMDEPIVMVKVINATPEPDGSSPKAYFLRVPPYIATAKEAVAWTFNMEGNEYEPSAQS